MFSKQNINLESRITLSERNTEALLNSGVRKIHTDVTVDKKKIKNDL